MNLAPIYSNLGYAYYGNKEYPKAMDAFGKALALDPEIFIECGGGRLDSAAAHRHRSRRLSTSSGQVLREDGDAEHAAHYLKLARDYGYKEIASVEKDPEFAAVIKDPRVQEVLQITAVVRCATADAARHPN